MKWQPIATAPTDTPCLVFMPAWSCRGHDYPSVITTAIAEFPGAYGWLLCVAGSGAVDRDLFPYPTHWIPLPEPPHD